MIKNSVRFFNNKEVRAIWDNEKSMWWYSAADIIDALVSPNSPRRYWNNVKIRNPELSPFCGRLKLYANDGKKYISDVINESGVRLLSSIVPTKYKKEIENWLVGMLDPIDEQSKAKAHALFESNLLDLDYVGKTVLLQQIHAYLFEGLYPFAGQIRTRTISKGGFTFANGEFLMQTLKGIDDMADATFDEIIKKYVEMNVAHPFMEGNGRATRIWLDLLLKERVHKCIDWSLVGKNEYLSAMKASPLDEKPIHDLLNKALVDDINSREIFIKGIDYSYYYEEE